MGEMPSTQVLSGRYSGVQQAKDGVSYLSHYTSRFPFALTQHIADAADKRIIEANAYEQYTKGT